jgi:hypothetical protein
VLNKRGLYVLSIFQDNNYPGLIAECRDVMMRSSPVPDRSSDRGMAARQ